MFERQRPSPLLHAATVGPLWSALLFAALLGAAQPAFCANLLANELARLGTQTMVLRTMALSDLGVAAPINLRARDSHRDLYLPVPAGIAISDASIRFSASYALPEAASTRLVLLLDNNAVSARSLTQTEGEAGFDIGVDGSARASGFVQLGIEWSSVAATARCAYVNAASNALHIRPGTRFSYRYDSAAIRDLPTAWGALPSAPLILTAGDTLFASSYDTAWRIGVALARSGRRPVVRALPQPGDDIDLSGVAIPAGLRSIPAFAALAQRAPLALDQHPSDARRHTLANEAEIGALLALGENGPLQADIVVSDSALHARMQGALDALQKEMRDALRRTPANSATTAAFRQWQARGAAALPVAEPHEVRLARFAGRPLIVLGAQSGAQAAGAFHAAWRRLARPLQADGAAASVADKGALTLTMAQLGGQVGSFDVAARGEWQVDFDIGNFAHGRSPTQAVLDIAAAPIEDSDRLSAAILLNDILLGSQSLSANGRAQHIAVDIPRYAQLPKNTLRIILRRPNHDDDCRASARGAPVSILPSSHIVFRQQEAADDFTGMMTRFSIHASLILPPGYLIDASASLARVIAIADAVGVSPAQATMLVSDGGHVKPEGPFLAFDLPQAPDREQRKVDGPAMLLAAYGERARLDPDADGATSRIALLKVARIGDHPGVFYRSISERPPRLGQPFTLGHGNLALLGQEGMLAELDIDGSASARLIAEAAPAWWRGAIWWLLPCVIVTLFISLLVTASHVRRRKNPPPKKPS